MTTPITMNTVGAIDDATILQLQTLAEFHQLTRASTRRILHGFLNQIASLHLHGGELATQMRDAEEADGRETTTADEAKRKAGW